MYLSVMLAAVTVFPFRTLGILCRHGKSEVFEIDRITVRKGFGYAVRECEGYAFDIATGGGTVALDIGADHSMVRCPELTTEAYTLLAASLSDGFWRADNL